MSRTIVFFHAHPDDEVLLTGGTMARLAAEGHRVVLVTATAGEAGLAAGGPGGALGELRRHELERSARLLGCARLEVLGYRDSGLDGAAGAVGAVGSFARLPVEQPAARLAELLREERADVLTGYDAAGGYGHPDHVQVHRVARRAAEIAATPALLEATVDRRALQRGLRVARLLRPRSADFEPSRFAHCFAEPATITHRIDVSRFLAQKRAAMQAHASQAGADGATTERTLAWMLRLPRPLYRLAFAREWFVHTGRSGSGPLLGDLLADVRPPDVD